MISASPKTKYAIIIFAHHAYGVERATMIPTGMAANRITQLVRRKGKVKSQ